MVSSPKRITADALVGFSCQVFSLKTSESVYGKDQTPYLRREHEPCAGKSLNFFRSIEHIDSSGITSLLVQLLDNENVKRLFAIWFAYCGRQGTRGKRPIFVSLRIIASW